MVEGASLLRRYTSNRIEGSNPFLSATNPIMTPQENVSPPSKGQQRWETMIKMLWSFCVAHKLHSRVEGAYMRSDLYFKREEIMNDWEKAVINS